MTQMVAIYRDGVPQYFEVRNGGAALPLKMKRFYFQRTNDVSGTSGVGIVAEGVQFSDKRVALRWITDDAPSSTVVYDSIEDAKAIHGHGGGTEIVWVDGR